MEFHLVLIIPTYKADFTQKFTYTNITILPFQSITYAFGDMMV